MKILQKSSKEKINSDLQWSNNAGFGNGDALLLHGFMDTCAVRIIHLRKSTNKGRKKWRISDLVLRTANKRWTFHDPTINTLETRLIFNQSKIKQKLLRFQGAITLGIVCSVRRLFHRHESCSSVFRPHEINCLQVLQLLPRFPFGTLASCLIKDSFPLWSTCIKLQVISKEWTATKSEALHF